MISKFDEIEVQKIRVNAILGLYPEERITPQDIIVSAKLYLDLTNAGQSDDLQDTVDYDSLHRAIAAMAEETAYLLIEKLADHAAQICLENPLVQACSITVEKPQALELADNIAITIHRSRK
jgi:FolB domain-containing protein